MNRMSDLLSVRTSVDFAVSHKIYANSRKILRELLIKKLFGTDGNFDLRRGEVFWRFPFWLDFLVWVIFHHEGITSASEACISQEDGLFACKKLFWGQLRRILELCSKNQMFLWTPIWFWLVVALSATSKMVALFSFSWNIIPVIFHESRVAL